MVDLEIAGVEWNKIDRTVIATGTTSVARPLQQSRYVQPLGANYDVDVVTLDMKN